MNPDSGQEISCTFTVIPDAPDPHDNSNGET